MECFYGGSMPSKYKAGDVIFSDGGETRCIEADSRESLGRLWFLPWADGARCHWL